MTVNSNSHLVGEFDLYVAEVITVTGHSHNASAKSSDDLKVVRSLATAELDDILSLRGRQFAV
jgi:hypothetical protein